ncbi:glycosyltransferase [Archaeoglobus veneficus]|uniref:Glycosyltransferase n=1 Tax=Archaeoglobus veneficus (strain DSM 11195 / SNP6) TaxID=693661 RepID=F2KQE5_ARCVS|nr:glycosyltransferase [Archaeoglobus veneficus]AEA46578.1 hypothetical protein Arcve_0554 [Archaeoglobus veneficus SNP6]
MDVKLKKELENYNYLKSKAIAAFREGKLEQALDYAYVAATYAWSVHLGIWYDEELEYLLSKIGECVNEGKDKFKYNLNKNQEKQKDVKSIAYVVSSLNDVGGHSEVLRQWVDILSNFVNDQYLYITNVSNLPTKYSYLNNFKNKGITIKQLDHNDSYVDRIKELIEYLGNDLPDITILFINPNDVIAVTTLLTIPNKPYVIFFNHADHVFWLGRNIVDLLVEWRSESVKYSKKFRKIDKSCIVPLTTNIKPQKVSKTFYDIPENSTLSISVGNFYKVLRDPDWDFFKTIEELLEKFPNHYHLFVTNPPPRNVLEKYLPADPDTRQRLIIDGPLPHLEAVYGVADFLIETFPCAGGMVRVEAMACGLPIIAIRNKKFSLLSETDALPPDYPFIASTEKEVVRYSSEFIENPEIRDQVGKWLYKYYKQKFSPEKVREILSSIIKNKINGENKVEMQSNFEELSYNLEYAYSWSRKNSRFGPNRNLLFQSILKQSAFSGRHRFKFYIESIKNREFISKKELVGSIVLAVVGWRGGILCKSLVLKRRMKFNVKK